MMRCPAPVVDPITGRAEFHASGVFRIYFNRHGAAPLMWCVCPDPDGTDGAWPRWEIAVRDVVIESGCSTRYERKDTPDDEDGRPSAWISTVGTLSVDTLGRAVIR